MDLSINTQKHCIVARVRELNAIKFWEFLLLFDEIHENFSIPSKLPERYSKRIHNLIAHEQLNIFVVHSTSDNAMNYVNLNSLKKGNGIWVIENDFEKKGGFANKVQGISQFMSLPIDDYSVKKVKDAHTHLLVNYSNNNFIKPLSLYHGTLLENIATIQKNGLQVSKKGMLGKAIYLGTFWKACRFSTKTQDYKDIENGCIIRTIVLTESIQVVPRKNYACKCVKCTELGSGAWGIEISDHNAEWKNTHEGIHAQVRDNNMCDEEKCVLRNEEWAFKEGVPLINTHYAQIDNQTAPKPHYDPFYRKTKII
jgi:hypothetical protein